MPFCPFRVPNANGFTICPETSVGESGCYLWNNSSTSCTIQRQRSLLEMIVGGTGVHLHSDPPTGYHKVLNIYYDESTDEHVVIREDNPV